MKLNSMCSTPESVNACPENYRNLERRLFQNRMDCMFIFSLKLGLPSPAGTSLHSVCARTPHTQASWRQAQLEPWYQSRRAQGRQIWASTAASTWGPRVRHRSLPLERLHPQPCLHQHHCWQVHYPHPPYLPPFLHHHRQSSTHHCYSRPLASLLRPPSALAAPPSGIFGRCKWSHTPPCSELGAHHSPSSVGSRIEKPPCLQCQRGSTGAVCK